MERCGVQPVEQGQYLRPDEKVAHHHERDPDQGARTDRGPRDAQLVHHPAACILQSQDVASPRAEEAAEEQGGHHHQRHEDEARRYDALMDRVQHLVELQRRQGAPAQLPVDEMGDEKQMYAHEGGRAPLAERAGPLSRHGPSSRCYWTTSLRWKRRPSIRRESR